MADTDKLVKVGQLDTIVDEIVDKFGETNGRLPCYPLTVNVTDGSYIVGSTGGIGTNANLGYSEVSMLPFRGKGIVIQSYLWLGAGYAFLDADGHYITGESANTKGISPATGELTKVETSVPYNAYSLRVSFHKSYTDHSSDYYFRITENKATKYVFVGDSYGTGYNASGSTTGWIDGTASSIGLKSADYDKKAKGGAGFRHPANDTPNETFSDLLNLSTLAKDDVGHIVVCGGYNDKIYSESQLLTAFEAFAAKAREKYPFAEICIGMIGHSGAESVQETLMNTVRQGYMQMANRAGVRYLSNVEYVLTDDNVSSDGIHPDQAGADTLATAIGNAVKTGGASGKSYQSEIAEIDGRLTQLNYAVINNDLLRAATWHKGFVKTDGTLTQATTDKTYNYTDMIPVEEGERYKYALDSSSGRLIIAAYVNADDTNAVNAKSVRGTDGMASGTYVVSKGVNYIRVTLRVAAYASQYFYKRTSLTETDERLTQQGTSIGDLSKLETETKTDLVAAINEAVQTGSGGGLTPEISTAILNCFQHVAWTSADGLAHYTALRVLLFPVTIIVNDNVMRVENADEIASVSKDGMTLILL